MGKVTAKKPKYIPRSQAVRKLHVSDRLFKRLCILNGIFPRVPNQAMKDKSKVYYHVNDIKYLARSPVLEKLRAKKISTKRIRRTLRSGDQEHADRLKKIAPKIPISFVLKERYPSFQAALKDLSDALNTVFLIAEMNAHGPVQSSAIKQCADLVIHWKKFVVATRILQKSFITAKGTYFQVDLFGVPIVWMEPHRFIIPPDPRVDMHVFSSFYDIHSALVKFVLFKLYTMNNFPYPPVDLTDDDMIASYENTIAQKREEIRDNAADEGNDDFIENLPQIPPKGTLLSNTRIFLSRETPISTLSLLIRSCGGQIVVEDQKLYSTTNSEAYQNQFKGISYIVIDRPVLEAKKEAPKTIPEIISFFVHQPQIVSVQPQYFFDSLNAGVLLPTAQYAPIYLKESKDKSGKRIMTTTESKLPAHVSPFTSAFGGENAGKTSDDDGGYVPKEVGWMQKQKKIAEGKIEDHDGADDDVDGMLLDDDSDEEKEEEEEEIDEDDRMAIDESESEEVQKPKKKSKKKKSTEKEFDDLGEEVVTGMTEAEERLHMQRMAMSKKDRYLWNKIQYGNKQKEEKKKKLEEKAKSSRRKKD